MGMMKKAKAIALPAGLVKCTCQDGKVTITVHEGDKPVRSMELTCVICDGAGKITKAKARAVKAEQAMWCQCGNPGVVTSYHPDGERGAACHKHHWTCDDCGKVVQVG
jgi:Fe2+ or Zn2+ uptake regulation protein